MIDDDVDELERALAVAELAGAPAWMRDELGDRIATAAAGAPSGARRSFLRENTPRPAKEALMDSTTPRPEHVEHVRQTGRLPGEPELTRLPRPQAEGYLAACKAEADRLDALEADAAVLEGDEEATVAIIRGRLLRELELVTRRQNLDGTATGLGDEDVDRDRDYREYMQLTAGVANLAQAFAALPAPPELVAAFDDRALVADVWQAVLTAGGDADVADAVVKAVRANLPGA